MRLADGLRLVLVAIFVSYAFYVAAPAVSYLQVQSQIRELSSIKREMQLAGQDVSLETKVLSSMRRESTTASNKAVERILKLSIASAGTALGYSAFRKFVLKG